MENELLKMGVRIVIGIILTIIILGGAVLWGKSLGEKNEQEEERENGEMETL